MRSRAAVSLRFQASSYFSTKRRISLSGACLMDGFVCAREKAQNTRKGRNDNTNVNLLFIVSPVAGPVSAIYSAHFNEQVLLRPKSLWNVPNAIHHICGPENGQCAGPDWSNGKIALDNTQILRDLGAGSPNQTCNLQQVSRVIPDGDWSDHPGPRAKTAGPPGWRRL
jgi:hypothetical protein